MIILRWADFLKLTKPRVISLIVFCALVGMLLSGVAITQVPVAFVAGLVGIYLVASGSAALNCVLERALDACMQRTIKRPLVQGSLPWQQACLFGILLCLIGLGVLWQWTNTLTMWLTFATFIGYAGVYTLLLKPRTPQNIVIGGAAGAMPPVLGWAALTGQVGYEAWLLFLIIFLWTPPHFWALALYRVDDYRNAGLPMLPVTHGSKFTRLHIVLYTILLSLISGMPFLTGMSGVVYLLSVLVLDVMFLSLSVRLWRNYSDALAKKTFVFSIWYLAGTFLALLIDHWLG